MAHQHSIFADSRKAAAKIMNEPHKPMKFESSDNARIRDHLIRNCGLSDAQATEALEGYNIVSSAKRMLGMG